MTYKALFLLIFINGTMTVITDTRGPYLTKAECKARLSQMQKALKRMPLPVAKAVGGCKTEFSA